MDFVIFFLFGAEKNEGKWQPGHPLCWKSRNSWIFWDRLPGIFPALSWIESRGRRVLERKPLIKIEAQF